MNDLDRGYQNYGILKRDWDEMNDLARQYGYTDDEILEIHRAAAAVGGYGQSQHQNFNTLVQIGRPGITRTPDFKNMQRRPSMLSNMLFRLNQLITRWLYRDHKRQYKNMEPSDD